MAQLGALKQATTKVPQADGGELAVARASSDGGVPIDVAQEYRELTRGFTGTLYGVLAAERLRKAC